jgi:hypothetical protein
MQYSYHESSRELTITATNLTTNFTSSSDVKDMVHQKASYQVIPAIPEIFSLDIWSLLIELLPLSQYLTLYPQIASAGHLFAFLSS